MIFFRLKGKHILEMSDTDFEHFCNDNPDLKIERLSGKELILHHATTDLPSTMGDQLFGKLYIWNKKFSKGKCFDNRYNFLLANNVILSPQAAWMSEVNLTQHKVIENSRLIKTCADFVIEIKTKNDALEPMESKMNEWISNGCHLAWLIDPATQTVQIYDSGKATKTLIGFDKAISGGTVLKGFEVKLNELGAPDEAVD